MRNDISLRQRARQLSLRLRERIRAPDFCTRHRRRPADFTRERKLTFPILMRLLLQKSSKSLQAHAPAFFFQLHQGLPTQSVSASARPPARAKLQATALVEWNRTVLDTVCGQTHGALVQRGRGHRLLGVDSSLGRLPSSDALGEHFGWGPCRNRHGMQERDPQARGSVFYDVLNAVAGEGRLAASTVAETTMAHDHLAAVQPGDVTLTDRGDTGYGWFVAGRAAQAHFVSRCSQGSFAAVQELFARDAAGVSGGVTLPAPPSCRVAFRERGWPLELVVPGGAAGDGVVVHRRTRSAGDLAVGRDGLSGGRAGGGVLGAVGARNG